MSNPHCAPASNISPTLFLDRERGSNACVEPCADEGDSEGGEQGAWGYAESASNFMGMRAMLRALGFDSPFYGYVSRMGARDGTCRDSTVASLQIII